jgi:hypothetical protein
MAHFVPSHARRGKLSRAERIARDYPQAAGAIKAIQDSASDLPFGTPIDRVLGNYHFPSENSVRDFFRVYLSRHPHDPVDDTLVREHLINTINCQRRGIPDDKYRNYSTFMNIFEEFQRQIDKNSAENVPLVNFIVGPTGAGKTAFSKALFTVCQRRFWESRMVPSRVEYSKFGKPRDGGEAIPYERDREFLSFVRRCQLRDLLIYFCSSGCVSREERIKCIAELGLAGSADLVLKKLVDRTSTLVFNGNDCVLDGVNRAIFDSAVRDLGDNRDYVLYVLASKLEVRFLVSFDGFDSTKLEHFLFERKRNVPINLLAHMVKGLHEKVVFPEMDDCPLESHYLVYLRDTTFAALRTKLYRKVGGSGPYPVYWIVPPPYSILVQNVAAFLTNNQNSLENLSSVFDEDIVKAFDRSVFDTLGLSASKHLAFVFGSSGRRMKAHIKSLLISALDRMANRDEADFTRGAAGIDARTVWRDLVTLHGVRRMPNYAILEDLFLNEERQLVPKLDLASGKVTELLDRNDFDQLLETIIDTDETSGTFGCLFNYFYRMTIGSCKKEQPGMLILIRVMQFISRHPDCNAGEVHDFLHAIGYRVPEQVTRFCLFVVIRCEHVRWDSSTGAHSIDDVPLFITTTGRIALEKLLFSTTYLSEAMLSSLQIDRELAAGLRERVPNSAIWIADCINNASITLYIIGEIEEIEKNAAIDSGVDFTDYLLYERIDAAVSKEAALILQNPTWSMRDRWTENELRLRNLRRRYVGLKILGSV